MSMTYCRFCELRFIGLYLNCPKCGKWLAPTAGADILPDPEGYTLAEEQDPFNRKPETVRVLRFMSRAEAGELLFGMDLHNDTNHAAHGNGTDSIGFCFALIDEDDGTIYSAARRLSGIVSMEVCLVGHLKLDPERFSKGYGYYADHSTIIAQRVKLPEISGTDYSAKDFSEFKLWLPNPNAGPLVYSESWREPVPLQGEI